MSSVMTDHTIFMEDKWAVREMELTPYKLDALWNMLQRYKTLFSDFTRADPANFINVISAPHTMWFEIVEYDAVVGIVWFGELHQMVDCTAHMVFFDRAPAEKINVCRTLMQWMFDNFPLRRMTVTPPEIYHATSRLLLKLGFTLEGRKREAFLIGGKWNDQLIYGITRQEALSQ